MGEQDYPGGTIPVCTPELNPVVLDVAYVTQSNYRYQFYLDSRYTGGTSTPINNVIIDLSAELPNLLGYAIGNDGDETIDLQAKAYIDGTLVVDQTRTNQAPGAQPLVLYSLVSSNLAAGSHTLQWILSACLSGTGSYVEYCNNTVTYYAYTAELNAYANSVSIVQDAIEQTWLVGAPGTLTEQAISMVPSIAAYFKFYLVNEGDEDVKMNVGHLVTDHYETGFAVDGAIIDTNEYDVYIAAGGTATITTQSFIPQPPSVAIGPFSILRTRAYESSAPVCAEGAHEVLTYCSDGITELTWRDCVGGAWVYGERTNSCPVPGGTTQTIYLLPDPAFNQFDVTVSDPRTIDDILGGYGWWNGNVWLWDPSGWWGMANIAAPFINGYRYGIYNNSETTKTITLVGA